MPVPSGKEGCANRTAVDPLVARRGTAVTDYGRGALAHAPSASGSEFAPSGALMGCARSERPTRHLSRSDETRAPDERDPLEASVRRSWREWSKRSSASVGTDAPFRGEPVVGSPTEAIARRPTATSRGSTCASSGRCSRPPARARRVSAWRSNRGASGRPAAEAIVPAIESNDRHRGIARREATDVAASRCRHWTRPRPADENTVAIVRVVRTRRSQGAEPRRGGARRRTPLPRQIRSCRGRRRAWTRYA